VPASRAQRAKTADRRAKAIALRLAGTEWEQIANALGYANRSAACKDVSRALESALAEQTANAEVLRETELMRLDRIQRGLWPAAIAGDTRAADTALRVIDRRVRLLGLDVPPDVEERLRNELVRQVGLQMSMVFGQVLDGLGLTDAQRALVPGLLERVIGVFIGRAGTTIQGEIAS
jgi:hypothetical protein